MAWTQTFPSAEVVEDRAELALRWPVGAVSPLWALFGAAAAGGVAWWWLTRWTQMVNVEALAGIAAGQVKSAIESAADSKLRVEEAVVVADLAAAGAAPTVTIEAAAPEAAPLEAAALDSAPPEAPPPEVASPAFEPAPAAAVVPLVADDLTRMVGIGPKLSAGLAERGVTRFAQIAAWTGEDLAEVDGALQLKGRAVREAWVAQAKRLAWD